MPREVTLTRAHDGLMGEQGESSDRNGAGASDDPAAAGSETASPTGDGADAASVSGSSVRFDDDLGGVAAVRVRRAARTIINLLAVTVRLVACVFAAILLVRIGLAFVPVNPHNVIVEQIVRFADIIVWGFRDLFLPSDPHIGLVANYGLAAVFWLAVGLIAARVLSGLGLLVAGRNRS
jgi:hypothetical protein